MASESRDQRVKSDSTGADRLSAQFAAVTRGRDDALRLDLCCLHVSRLIDPAVDAMGALASLDGIGAEIAGAGGDFAALRRVLYERRGFGGDAGDYYNPRNSCLATALERRSAIPITLAVIAIEAGRRAGLRIDGIGAPAHFLIRHGDRLYDPFNGAAEIDRDDVLARLRGGHGGPGFGSRAESFLTGVTKRQILQRVLVNLKGALARQRRFARAADACSYLLALAPWAFEEQRDRGLLRYEAGNPELALEDLAAYARNARDARDVKHVAALVKRIRSEAGT